MVAGRDLVPKVFQSAAVNGVSEQAMQEHLAIYRGCVAKVNEIRGFLTDGTRHDVNSVYSQFRALKTSEIDAIGSVLLHELYFDTISGGSPPSRRMRQYIELSFGSVDRWASDITAAAMAARSWVVLAEDPFSGYLFHCCQDSSDQGIWGCRTLLALDICEHAYSRDFGTRRKDYVNAFIGAINWQAIEERLDKGSGSRSDARGTADAKLSSLFYYPVYPVYRAKKAGKRKR